MVEQPAVNRFVVGSSPTRGVPPIRESPGACRPGLSRLIRLVALLLLWKNLGHVGHDHFNGFVVQFAFLERVVRLHHMVHIKDDRHIGVLGEVVFLGAGRIVDCQNGLF